MSDSPAAPPSAGGADSLAPPQPLKPVRSNSSSTSTRSNGSRRGGHRSAGSSASVSRSNSHSSQGTLDNRRKGGNTTTVSGGTSLGGRGSISISTNAGPPSFAKQDHKRTRTKGNQSISRLSQAMKAAPPRPSSANTDKSTTATIKEVRETREKSPSPGTDAQINQIRSILAASSPPVTAMEAAVNAATKKHVETHGGDALTSLQRMIADLKTISPTNTAPPSRSVSGAAPSSSGSSGPPQDKTGSSPMPITIPTSAGSANTDNSGPLSSSTKLKADAPSFTPGSLRTGQSPTTLMASLPHQSSQPPAPQSQPQQQQQGPRSAGSHNPRRQSAQASVSLNPPGFPTSPTGNATSPLSAGYLGLPHFPLVSSQQQGEGDDFGQFGNADVFQQQQQLLAAQQLQLQILQAQLLNQQQLSTQQQREQGFIAPRFQALAAQRAALQQQQSQQLAEAQRLFEHHQQQQLLLAQQQQQLEEARAAQTQAGAGAPPVFEEDSPEPTPQLGPTGRPQLNPGFTFGKRRESKEEEMRAPAVVVNRSEGIGGAAATGLAGLAARAHKRSGSEITPAMEEQLEIQRQIEALQAKQKALMQQDKPSPIDTLGSLHKSSQSISRHRRSHSGMSATSAGGDTFSSPADEPSRGMRAFPNDVPPLSAGGSHSRRHSVNNFSRGGAFGEYVEDSIPGFGGHNRSGSRSGFESGNWRMTNNGGGGGGGTADLASAQAQLASLARFRAAAGSGHAKMASFSFPNMLPNLLVATTLQGPSGSQSSLWQQQQAFQMQLQQNQQGPQRKSLFAPYLPQASLPPLLSAGKLVVGILRVNKKNRSDAYVATDVLDADIYICGSKDRNRALEGDIVAVELLDVDEVWSTKKDKEEKKRKKEESYDIKPSTAKKLEKKKDDIEVEGQGLTLFEDEEVNDETKPTYAGHVVAVVERMPGQLFSGQLGVLRPSSAATKEKQEAERREREGDRGDRKSIPAEPEPRPKIVWFKPTDKRVPLIAIPTEQAPVDFIENPEAHANSLFVATIKRWPITSLHPFGTLVEELGPIGNCEVETSAILKDCNFPTEEFADVALKCLPPLPWTIPDREFDVRMDLRNECVFTIDPQGARDLDDALSIKTNDDGTYTVGVHIADVSYFVKANTALDRDARKRATSVYLTQRAVPMLPPLLCEQLCSLVPDVERLTFSAFFVLDQDANVLERSYRRAIIKSTAQLSYGDAAKVLAGGSLDATKVSNSHPASQIESDVKLLHSLATKLRTKRIDDGAMLASRSKLTFTLDDEGRPTDCALDEPTPANSLVEEFMLLTNTSIAAVIANGLPEQALLRRHEAPLERRITAFVDRAKRNGFEFDATNAGTLQKSFDKIQDKEDTLCLNLLGKKTLQHARYFCTGMLDIAKYSHWALNLPLYTHFTSPIRRYPDVLVHRMLDACLSSRDVKFHMDRDQIAKCAQQSNMKRQSARLAEDQSVHLYLSMLISSLSARHGPVVRHAKVTAVYDQAFDVVIPEFALEKRIHIDKMPVENSVFDEHTNTLSLYWSTQDVLSHLTRSVEDDHLHKIKQRVEGRATGAATQLATADSLLDDEPETTSVQEQKSASPPSLEFQGLRKTPSGHRIQDIKEFSSLPVIVTADMSKSPPVLVVYACNPYAAA